MRNRTFKHIHAKLSGSEDPGELPRRRHLERLMQKALAAGTCFGAQVITETQGLRRTRRMYRAMKAATAGAGGHAVCAAVLEGVFLLGIARASTAEHVPKEVRMAGIRFYVRSQQRLVLALTWLEEARRSTLLNAKPEVVGIDETEWQQLLTNCLAVAHTAKLLARRGLQVWFSRPKERADLRIALVAAYEHRPGGLCVEVHGSREHFALRVETADADSGRADLSRLAERTKWFSLNYPGDWCGIRVHVGFSPAEDGLTAPPADLPSWIVSDRRRIPRLVPPLPTDSEDKLAACG